MSNNKKVLIAEDDNFLSEVYVTKLVSENFDVFLAQNGEEALEIAKEKIPDVLLLDIFMPEMNGIEVLRKVRTNTSLADVAILVLTNANEKEFLEQAQQLGVKDYLIKSHYTPDEVVSKIKEILIKTKR